MTGNCIKLSNYLPGSLDNVIPLLLVNHLFVDATGEIMDMMKKMMQQMLEKTTGSGSKEMEKKGER